MAAKQIQEAQNPLILRCNRLIEAFTKSDDERDFYLDRNEGFIIYLDLDKSEDELNSVEREINSHKERYCLIPKLTFYETKKIMEGFVNEKVYDIDTKEKLLDIIQSKEARENFLDFIYDHHSELEKWQTYYQERSRIRIIEWLRNNNFHFVFEEDLDIAPLLIEKIKKELFQSKASKEVLAARKLLSTKAKSYYSNEALNPRPKRGRPPKQALKAEIEPQITTDIYTMVPQALRSFLFTPDLNSTSSTFSSRFGNEDELFSRRLENISLDSSVENLNQKLAALRTLSNKWTEPEAPTKKVSSPAFESREDAFDDFEEEEDDEDFDDYDDEEDFEDNSSRKPKKVNNFKKPVPTRPKSKPAESKSKPAPKSSSSKKPSPAKNFGKPALGKPPSRSPVKNLKTPPSKIAVKPVSKPAPLKAKPKPAAKKAVPNFSKSSAKGSPASKKKPLRPMKKLKRKSR